jgi:lysozyme
MSKFRIAVGALSLSAAGFIGLAVHEGYSDTAIIPVKGDVPTIGFGETQGVRMGDKIDPVRALIRFQRSVTQYEKAVQTCTPVPMAQVEFDLYVSHTYNIGVNAYCTSTMAKKLNKLDYVGACNEFPVWKKFQGKDCSLSENARLCGGIWTRRLESQSKCLAAQ